MHPDVDLPAGTVVFAVLVQTHYDCYKRASTTAELWGVSLSYDKAMREAITNNANEIRTKLDEDEFLEGENPEAYAAAAALTDLGGLSGMDTDALEARLLEQEENLAGGRGEFTMMPSHTVYMVREATFLE